MPSNKPETDFTRLTDFIWQNRRIVAVPEGREDNERFAATALKNLEDYGFTVDQAGFESLKTAEKKKIEEWYYGMASRLNELAGGNHEYHPFYPDFPARYMDHADLTRFLEQLLHYLVGYRPEGTDPKDGIKSLEQHPVKVLGTIREEDRESVLSMAGEIFSNLVNSKQNLAEHQLRSLVSGYILAVPEWTEMAGQVTNRETLCLLYLAAMLQDKKTAGMTPLVTGDYLRLAKLFTLLHKEEPETLEDSLVMAAGADIKELKTGTLTRKQRLFIAKGLDAQRNLEEDIARDLTEWKHCFRYMHAGEFQDLKNLQKVVEKVRNNKTLGTFYGRVEDAFQKKDLEQVIRLYRTRPGEFVKNINRLIVLAADKEENEESIARLLDACQEVFGKTRPEDLLNLVEYIHSRTREDRLPVHNVRGKLIIGGKQYVPIQEELAGKISGTAIQALAGQVKGFGTDAEGKKVYIDQVMYSMAMPKDVKDSSESMFAYTKGSRIPIEKDEDGQPKNLRYFVWWTNTRKEDENGRAHEERVDIDLSAGLLCRKGNAMEVVGKLAYYDSGETFNCVHSGDITDGGDPDGPGACEYIDLDMQELREGGVDYVKMYVNSFTGDTWDHMNVEFGWQEREELDSSKQFDIRAVKQHSKLSGKTTGNVAVYVDVKDGSILWTDSPDYRARTASNLESQLQDADIVFERYDHGDRPSMGFVAETVAKVQGLVRTENREEADIVIALSRVETDTEIQEVITAMDQDIWLGRFSQIS